MNKVFLMIFVFVNVLASGNKFSVPISSKNKKFTPYQLDKAVKYGMKDRYSRLLIYPEGTTLYMLRRVNTSKEPEIKKSKVNFVPLPNFTFYSNPSLRGEPVIITKEDGLYFGDRNIFEIERAGKSKNSHLGLDYDYFSLDVYSSKDRIKSLLNVPFYLHGGEQYISISKELKKSFQVKVTLEGKDQFLYFDKSLLNGFLKIKSKDSYIKTLLAPQEFRELSKEYLSLISSKNTSGIYKIVKNCFGFYPLKRNASKNDIKKFLSNPDLYKKFLKLYNIDNWGLNFYSSYVRGGTNINNASLITAYREKNDLFIEYYEVISIRNSFTGARCLNLLPFIPESD